MVAKAPKISTEDLARIVDNADQALQGLDVQIAGEESNLGERSRAVQLLTAQIADANDELQQAEAAHDNAALEVANLRQSVALSVGTVAEESAVATLKDKQAEASAISKELKSIRSRFAEHLPRLEQDLAAAQQAETKQREVLDELRRQREHLVSQRVEAHRKLGEAIFAEGNAKITEIEQAIGQANLEQLRLQVELEKAKKDIVAKTRAWSDLHKEARRRYEELPQPADDGQSLILAAWLDFWSKIERYGQGVGDQSLAPLLELHKDALRWLLGAKPVQALDLRNYIDQRRRPVAEALQQRRAAAQRRILENPYYQEIRRLQQGVAE